MRKRILEIIVALFWFSQFCYSPHLPPHLAGLGASATLIGSVVGIYGLIQLFLRIPAGVAMGRTGAYRGAVSFACICTALAALGTWLTQNPYVVLACRGLSGLGSAMWAGFAILYNSYFAEGDTTRSMGNLNMFNSAGKLTAYVLGGLLAQQFGYRSLFLLCVFVGGAGFLLSLFIPPAKVEKTAPGTLRLLKAVIRPQLIILGGITGIHYMMSTATSLSFVSSVAVQLGASSFQLSALPAISTATSLVVLAFMAPLTRRLGENVLVYASFIGMGLYCLANIYAPNVWVLMAVQVLGGMVTAIIPALSMAMSIRDYPPELQSTAISVFQATYSVGMTIGPVVMGVLVDHFSYKTGFWVYALLGLAGAVAAKLLLKMKRAEKGPQPAQ